MTPYPSFEEFYHAVHGFSPYEWQKDIANHVSDKGYFPEHISVPTGLGKTSNIDIAVWGIGKQIHEGKKRTLGQRIVLAVERQVIVDGISHHVQNLVEKVNSSSHEHVSVVRNSLLELSFDGVAVKQETFHGTRRTSGEWVDASGVTIIATTVTQVTLRLLGQAPGVSRGVAPIHAGLLAKDSLIIIDEPHLVTEQVSALKQMLSIEPGLSHICIMGATVQKGLVEETGAYTFDKGKENTFALQKITQPKTLNTRLTSKGSVDQEAKSIVTEYIKKYPDLRVGVIVNTISNAQSIAKSLKNPAEKNGYSIRVITSHIRGAERPTPKEIGAKREIIVATQTVEAGVDFTVDVLVSELCPIPSLWQRLGRLNRDGTSTLHRAYVIIPKHDDFYGSKSSQFIYGTTPLDVAARGLMSLGEDENVCVDNQPHIENTILEVTNSSREDMWPPLPTPVTINKDVISRILGLTTSPNLDVSAFLSGIVKDSEDKGRVSVMWRDPLPVEGSEMDRVVASLDVLPPMAAEMVSLTVDKARDLTKKRKSRYVVSDGVGNYQRNGKITPGDIIVFSADAGGLTDTGIQQDNTEKVSDVSMKIALNEDLKEKNRFAPLTQTMLNDMEENNIVVQDYYDAINTGTESAVDVQKRVSEDMSQLLGFPIETKIRDGVISIRRKPPRKTTRNDVVYLDTHLSHVGNLSSEYGKRIGLDDTLVASLQRAGLFHDLGKARDEFQVMLGKLDADRHLAKSSGRTSMVNVSGLQGYLHEIAGAEYVLRQHGDMLASWVIAAHHGRTRGVTRRRADLVRYVPMREELEKRYGVYGLIYLESVMRCADWRASASPDYGGVVEEAVVAAIDTYDSTYETPSGKEEEKENFLPGLFGGHLPSWYAVVGILVACEEIGVEVRVKWVDTIPVLNIDDGQLCSVLSHIRTRYVSDFQKAHDEVFKFSYRPQNTEVKVSPDSKKKKNPKGLMGLKIRNQRIVIAREDVRELFESLDGNLFQYLFSPWIPAGSPNKDLGEKYCNWSFVIPFLASNSNVMNIDLHDLDVDTLFASVKNTFVGRESLSAMHNLHLEGDNPVASMGILLLALYGGVSVMPVSKFGLGSTLNNNRIVPLPDMWVSLCELIVLTHGVGYFGSMDGVPFILGENDREQAQKILPGVVKGG